MGDTRTAGSRFVDVLRGRWGLRSWQRCARQIVAESATLEASSDAELNRAAAELRWQASAGAALEPMLTRAYALVREAAKRVHGQPHYDIQIAAGAALFHRIVAEMQTGEGKTLTAILPTFLHALAGQGCHIVTANDYLASRDAEFARPIFARLGMTVGCLQSELERGQRAAEYACDVTYGTAREFGFDFLRDRMLLETGEKPVQRGLHFAIVDEADSVLIDDARTPLLIAAAAVGPSQEEGVSRWCDDVAQELSRGIEFVVNAKLRLVELTKAGCQNVLKRRRSVATTSVEIDRLYRQVEHALVARHLLQSGRDYVLDELGVGIVDESTGRVAEGRRWQDGLHQAVEAKERVAVSAPTQTAARVTVQDFFRRYRHLAGLTGTAQDASREFKHVYDLPVVVIPTRRDCQRKQLPCQLFASQAAKYQAIARDVARRVATGQAVLVGTPSVSASEQLSQLLRESGLKHEVLNCHHHAREAEIVTVAGQAGRITIATNMAGRGTDIRVDEDVQELGGLHVIATERHSHARIDRQLVGRTARQGEPGSYQFFLSLEDELFREGDVDIEQLRRRTKNAITLPRIWLSVFERAQRSIARRHVRQRRSLLKRQEARDRVCRDLGLDSLLDVIDS